MPFVRRENSRKAANRKSSNTNANDTASLWRLCVEKRLSSHGRRNILISRLEKHAATSTLTVVSNPTTSQQPDDTRSSLMNMSPSLIALATLLPLALCGIFLRLFPQKVLSSLARNLKITYSTTLKQNVEISKNVL